MVDPVGVFQTAGNKESNAMQPNMVSITKRPRNREQEDENRRDTKVPQNNNAMYVTYCAGRGGSQ